MFSYTLIKALVTLGVFTYLSALDVKTREIDPKIWIFLIPIVVLLTVIEIISYGVYAVISLFVIGVIINTVIAILFYYFNLFGGADMFGLITLSMAVPIYNNVLYNRLIILEQLLIPLYASVIGITLSIIFFIYNVVKKNWNKLPNVGNKGKILLLFMGVPVTINRYVNGMKFFYPLTIYKCQEIKKNNPCTISIRYSFNIDEEYQDHIQRLKGYLNKGLVLGDDIVWVTYGLPFIVNLTIAYALILVNTDILLFKLLGII